MEVSLRDYLGGHAMRKAMMEFEDALNPFVKGKVQAYFPEDSNDPYVIAFKGDLTVRKCAREFQRETLKQELANKTTMLERLQPKLDLKDKTAKKQAKVLQKRQLNIPQELSKLDSQETEDEAKTPDPRWIRECRQFFGRTMKPFVNVDNRWDVFVLVPEIFSSTFPDDFHAKEFLTSILRVVGARNGRAHQAHAHQRSHLSSLTPSLL